MAFKSTPEVIMLELEKLRTDNEWPEQSFVRALCTAFMGKALAYCEASSTPTERLQRVAELSALFRGIELGGLREFSIAAEQLEVTAADGTKTLDYRCLRGQRCIDGNCV